MRKLMLSLLLLMLTAAGFSQVMFTIQGTVTSLQTSLPVPNHPVTIQADSSTGFYYYKTVYTNSNGFFLDTIMPNTGVFPSMMYVSTYDCMQVLIVNQIPTNPSTSGYTTTFTICTSAINCVANFSYNQIPNTFNVQFIDQSIGADSLWNWNFGDGTTSTATNPIHAYGSSGWYNVTLTIGAPGLPCYNSITQSVYVSGNGGGCIADFTSYPDSLNPNTIQFFNQSTGNIQYYWWDFGDGTTSNVLNPVHSYTAPGTYNVCLTVQGVDSACYDMTCHTVIAGGGGGGDCNAAFIILADSLEPLTYHFIDQSTGNIAQYTWSFGDGSMVTVSIPGNPNVSHTYSSPGIYLVGLTVQNNSGNCFDITYDTLVVGGTPVCNAAFLVQGNVPAGVPVQFTDASTGNIDFWFWDFGDPASGSANTSTLQNPVHTFTAAGTYTVCLTIRSADSTCYDSFCLPVVITGQGCEANFTYNVGPPAGNTVFFTDLSYGDPVSWYWTFGNGLVSTEQNPVVTFSAPGTYNVCLTITTANAGCTSTYCSDVVIMDSTAYNTLYGQVFAGDFPMTPGVVMIFSFDTTGNVLPYFDASPVDSNGIYFFTMVPDGNYFILAVPFDSGGYFPTYFGNTINWQEATVVSLGDPANPYNISLVQCDQIVPGPGSASGQINMGDVSASLMDKINMIILNEQNQPIGYTHVQTSGSFSFPSLAYGTYHLHPEMPGVTSDYIRIVLSPDQPHAEVVMIFQGNHIQGVGIQEENALVGSWSVYPNPVREKLTISIEMKSDIPVRADILDMTGKVVATLSSKLARGSNVLNLPVSGLQTGIYLLRIYSEQGVNISTRFLKIR